MHGDPARVVQIVVIPLAHIGARAVGDGQIAQVTEAFRVLARSVPGITDFEDGVNNSPEGKNQGFTHVYVLTFENAAARDAYLPHPEHKKFGQVLGKSGIFVDAFVVDYVPHVTK